MQWLCANPPKDLSPALIDLIPGLPEAPEPMRADTYDLLWNWSVQHPAAFWTSLWHYFEVMEHTPFQVALPDARMPGARWFEGATLNYAEHVFRKKSIRFSNRIFTEVFFENRKDLISRRHYISHFTLAVSFLDRASR
jgi:hypothetical protein